VRSLGSENQGRSPAVQCSVGSVRAPALIRAGLAWWSRLPPRRRTTERTRCFTWSANLVLPVGEVNESTPPRAPHARQQGGGPRWADTSDCQGSHAGHYEDANRGNEGCSGIKSLSLQLEGKLVCVDRRLS